MDDFRQYYRLEWRGQQLQLLPQKALYWEEEACLILGDLHLGKVGHFRKEGIAVPLGATEHDLRLLDQLIRSLPLRKLLFLGDLFHSDYNSEWKSLVEFTALHPDVEFILVRGNHDLLDDFRYKHAGIRLVDELQIGPFCFAHDPAGSSVQDSYRFCGHIHPAVRLKGRGMRSLRVACFFFGENEAILPAFGRFTGKHVLKPGQSDRVYGVLEDKVIAL